ncbi:MAG: hypothetical protein GX217_06910 [Clostridiaceae bacterium]|nr:hypothetical protein [Clostridiaceae bacterium]
MENNHEIIRKQPSLHFSICSSNKELFLKFEQFLKKDGMIGIPDLQGNLHYIVDARKGFYTAYSKVKQTTLELMEQKLEQNENRIIVYEKIADTLVKKYEFDRSLIGTKFISYMIVHCLLDKSLMVSLSKKLYPVIAKIFSSTVNKVCYSTRYTLRKVEILEKRQRQDKVIKEYLLPENTSYSNSIVLHKLINEGELMLQKISQQIPTTTARNKISSKIRTQSNEILSQNHNTKQNILVE